jgi:hypothetical protein
MALPTLESRHSGTDDRRVDVDRAEGGFQVRSVWQQAARQVLPATSAQAVSQPHVDSTDWLFAQGLGYNELCFCVSL